VTRLDAVRSGLTLQAEGGGDEIVIRRWRSGRDVYSAGARIDVGAHGLVDEEPVDEQPAAFSWLVNHRRRQFPCPVGVPGELGDRVEAAPVARVPVSSSHRPMRWSTASVSGTHRPWAVPSSMRRPLWLRAT
jgi:hypothetical protein